MWKEIYLLPQCPNWLRHSSFFLINENWGSFPGIEWLGPEIDHSSPFRAWVKNEWNCTIFPPYMPWRHRHGEVYLFLYACRLRLKRDGTRAELDFVFRRNRRVHLNQRGHQFSLTTGSRGVRISGSNGSNAGYTMFRGSVKRTGYPLHLPVSPSLTFLCATMCHHISIGLYHCISPCLYTSKSIWTRRHTCCSLQSV